MAALVGFALLMLAVVVGFGVLAGIRTTLELERRERDALRWWEDFEWRDGDGRVHQGHRVVKIRSARERFAAYRPTWERDAARPEGPFADYKSGQWR